jgi:hypothetical protein
MLFLFHFDLILFVSFAKISPMLNCHHVEKEQALNKMARYFKIYEKTPLRYIYTTDLAVRFCKD